MDVLFWILIIALFFVSYIGLVYPILPSVLFIAAGYVVYGLAFSFAEFSILFWSLQIMFVVILFVADYATNLIGIQKYGGSKAAVWGSTIGLLIGPFVIPVAGILIGPFIGAVLPEVIWHKKSFREAFTVGFGTLLGFFSSIVVKGFIQTFMIVYFLVQVL
ncbi:DUF456 family protein [Bacillus sp. HMF5848]|uniref:DUF456 domain-containing protein n=1 Tax=Bacillus sp. HMF5848 TaxID=2495421 RepID=UPI000F782065|nr:DUF456 family protein [Bacillus sp. HMF5848]RSK27859.1 DUF456 family protein [Bacillus sp. HMF5848]